MHYKLRCTLVGHEADVRAVAPALFPVGGVLTASRDQSARLWIPENGGFIQSNIFCGRQNATENSPCFIHAKT